MRSQQSFMSFMSSKESAIPKKDIDRLCCAKCRFSTKDTELFERHVSHHKEVTFSCALCPYVSYSKTESQKHIVSHTGSYPYRCSFCSYGAVRRDYMVKHILRIHKRNAEEGFITDFALPSPAVPESPGMSGWPEGIDQCAITNSQVQHPSGSQPRINKSSTVVKAVSQTSSNRARVTFSMPTPCVTNITTIVPVPVSKTQFSNVIPSCTSSASHSLGIAPQVILRSREENGNLSNSLLGVDGQSKASKATMSEKLIPKVTFSRVQVSSKAPLRQSPRVGVPEKAVHPKTIPRVQVRPPIETNTPLRPLLNMPLSKRNANNVQMDQRASQSTIGINATTLKTSTNPSVPIRNQLHSIAEKSNQAKTNSRVLVGSSAETSSPLSSVQVELLAPLNQPIQHNKPLTVSCPEEINIPAGCLVELVEVKNVNGTRELELRLIPPNGIPQDQRSNEDRPSTVNSGSKLSFKCQVDSTGKGFPVSPSTSSTSHKVKQPQPSASNNVQSITNTVHSGPKPQCSSEIQARNKLNLKTKYPGPKHLAATHDIATLEAPELSSEGLPVISSVFSLCPTPTQIKEPKDDVGSAKQSLVYSFLIKKEEEPEEKLKDASLCLKETKKEDENTEGPTLSKTLGQVQTPAGSLFKPDPNLTVVQPLVTPNQTVVPSDKDNISHQDKGHFEQESGRNLDCQPHCASLMYPKVALVRIPSSLIEPPKKLPEAPTREFESLTARPVLCCTLSEQNVPGGPAVAIKLILKRDFRESQEKHQEHDSPPRKKHKKEKRKAKKRRSSSSVEIGLPSFPFEGHQLRLTPLRADQLVKIPGPNQPVVVLNHPNPLVQSVNVGVQTLENYKWIRSVDHEQGQPVQKQPSLKMKLKKVHGEKYQVVELILNGLSDKQLS
ncbi:zinc finger protein 518B [Pseudorasbora parva]|uniref:zinc finger protein 518B n=1 Tax=Pseudorasbora parva TaxID=51549 RepID=UPI00351F7514